MPDVSKFIERAEQESRRKNHDQAIALYKQILDIDPDCGEARTGIRRAALKKFERRYPSAIERGVLNLPQAFGLVFAGLFKSHGAVASLCEASLARDPKNVKLNHRLGHALLALGHEKSAEAAFAVVTEFDQKDSSSLKILGELYAKRKELDKALECFEKALKINPRDQEAGRMRKNLAAEGAIQRGGYEGAQSARELAKDQQAVQRAESKKRIVRTAKDVAAAIDELETQLEEQGSDAATLTRLGDLLVQKGDLDDAIDRYLAASKLEPDSAELADKLGDARIRRYETRIKGLEAEAKSGEDGAEDRLRRLGTELKEFRVEEFQRRVQVHPTDTGLRYRLGRYLIASDDLDEAIEHLQQAVNDPKHNVSSLHLLGRAFAGKGLPDLAAKKFHEAADKLGGMTDQKKEILYELALVHERAGEAPEALTVLKTIYESDIGYRDVGQRIAALS